MKNFDNLIEKVRKLKTEIAQKYRISESSIVWMGDCKFIAVVGGKEIIIAM